MIVYSYVERVEKARGWVSLGIQSQYARGVAFRGPFRGVLRLIFTQFYKLNLKSSDSWATEYLARRFGLFVFFITIHLL